jgi:hypothetical protein
VSKRRRYNGLVRRRDNVSGWRKIIATLIEHYIYPAQCAVCVVQRRYHHHHLIKQNTGGNIFKVKLVYGISNATFNNISVISWRSILLVEVIGLPGENHQSVASHWKTWNTDRMVVGFTNTCAIMPITTKVVSSNPDQARCTRYNSIPRLIVYKMCTFSNVKYCMYAFLVRVW